jgi:fucose permease
VGGSATTPIIGLISEQSSLANGLLIAGTVSFLYIAFIGFKALTHKKQMQNQLN